MNLKSKLRVTKRLSCLCFIVLFMSCVQDVGYEVVETNFEEFDAFFSSDAYASFSKSFNVDIENFDVENILPVKYPEQNVNLYQTLIVKNSETLGRLVIFSKNVGEEYRVLFEDWSQFDEECGGIISLCTANKQFIADFSCVKVDQESNLFNVSFNSVATIPEFNRLKSTTVEMPDRESLSWWECTTQCYQMAHDACSGDAECDFLCELIGLGTNVTCFVTISAACGIWCTNI